MCGRITLSVAVCAHCIHVTLKIFLPISCCAGSLSTTGHSILLFIKTLQYSAVNDDRT